MGKSTIFYDTRGERDGGGVQPLLLRFSDFSPANALFIRRIIIFDKFI